MHCIRKLSFCNHECCSYDYWLLVIDKINSRLYTSLLKYYGEIIKGTKIIYITTINEINLLLDKGWTKKSQNHNKEHEMLEMIKIYTHSEMKANPDSS